MKIRQQPPSTNTKTRHFWASERRKTALITVPSPKQRQLEKELRQIELQKAINSALKTENYGNVFWNSVIAQISSHIAPVSDV